MIKPIDQCTDAELSAIVRATGPNAVERKDALAEMGKRVARQFSKLERVALRRKFDTYD